MVGVPDEQFLSILWPVDAERDSMTSFLRDRRLSVFAEPRAAWWARAFRNCFLRFPRIGASVTLKVRFGFKPRPPKRSGA